MINLTVQEIVKDITVVANETTQNINLSLQQTVQNVSLTLSESVSVVIPPAFEARVAANEDWTLNGNINGGVIM